MSNKLKARMAKFNIKRINVPKSTIRKAINMGCLLDIAGGELLIGARGETFINGGLQQFMGLVGSTNNYKTTIAHFMVLTGLTRILESYYPSSILTYDTESTISIKRLQKLASNVSELLDELITGDNPLWDISDASMVDSNTWIKKFDTLMEEISKDKNLRVVYECFIDPYTKKPIEDVLPSFGEVDSLSKLSNTKMLNKLDDNDLDSSDTNTIFLNEGMFKTKLLRPLPNKLIKGNMYMIMTAHVTEKINLATGPAAYIVPSKQLQFLRGGDNIKGTTNEFKQITNICYQAHTAKLLNNKSTRLSEYPLDPTEKATTDLNCVTLTILRNKLGGSGYSIPIVVSQKEGVIPELSEFHFIKEVGKFGIEGSNISYHLILEPETNLSRTTVRRKLKENPKTKRALNITAEILQLEIYHSNYLRELGLPTMTSEFLTQMYDTIKGMGYDWDKLLDSRGYWLIDQYNEELTPFLSSVDVLKMAIGKYHPYWYPKEGIKNPYLDSEEIKKYKK